MDKSITLKSRKITILYVSLNGSVICRIGLQIRYGWSL